MASLLQYGIMLVASGLPALASPMLEERAKCSRDNLLRCYDPTGTKPTDIASRSGATAFCSSYLSIPVVTSTITTTTPLSTVTSIVTTTDGTVVVTSVSTTVFVEESTVTTTVPATISTVAPAKQAVAVVAGPACAATPTYASSSLSSACSCLSVMPSTTFVTATAATSTSVTLSTVHDTSTTTTETTTTTTATSTTTIIATASPSFTCGEPITPSNGVVYQTGCDEATEGVDPEGDLPNTAYTADLPTCLQLCVTNYAPRCVAINWYTPAAGVDTGLCVIMYGAQIVTDNDGSDTAYISGVPFQAS